MDTFYLHVLNCHRLFQTTEIPTIATTTTTTTTTTYTTTTEYTTTTTTEEYTTTTTTEEYTTTTTTYTTTEEYTTTTTTYITTEEYTTTTEYTGSEESDWFRENDVPKLQECILLSMENEISYFVGLLFSKYFYYICFAPF